MINSTNTQNLFYIKKNSPKLSLYFNVQNAMEEYDFYKDLSKIFQP